MRPSITVCNATTYALSFDSADVTMLDLFLSILAIKTAETHAFISDTPVVSRETSPAEVVQVTISVGT